MNRRTFLMLMSIVAAILAAAVAADAWDVKVTAEKTPGCPGYGTGTTADPLLICVGDDVIVTFTAVATNPGKVKDECYLDKVIWTWSSPGGGGNQDKTTVSQPCNSAGNVDIRETAYGKGMLKPDPNFPDAQCDEDDRAGTGVFHIVVLDSSWRDVSVGTNGWGAPPPSSPYVHMYTQADGDAEHYWLYQKKGVVEPRKTTRTDDMKTGDCNSQFAATATLQVLGDFSVLVGAGVTVTIPLGTIAYSVTKTHTFPQRPQRAYRTQGVIPQWKYVDHQTMNCKQYHDAYGWNAVIQLGLSDIDVGKVEDDPNGSIGWHDQSRCC